MEEKERIEKLKKIAAYVRKTALGTILNANNGHIGGNMSSVELLTAMYFGGIFNFDPEDSKNENRDRILIRGHEGPLRYTLFSLLNYIDKEELNTYRSLGSRLQGHEDMKITPGVDITPSGSLGMLLSYGVGSAIANSDKKISAKTIVFLGDGEEQEGNVSEAARHATTLNLNNLICIVDQNKKQLSRPTQESDGHDLKKIWEGYGWNVLEIENGHDLEEILNTYKLLKNIDKPTMVIAHTIKGYGVKGCEEHYSGYHTLSSAKDKKEILKSYHDMKQKLLDQNISFENIKEISQELLIKPECVNKKELVLNPEIFNLIPSDSTVSPQEAHEQYLVELSKKLPNDINNMYYITPDLYRKPEVEELGYKNFMHFIDTGIREQHAIAMSHGISVENPDARIILCFGDAFIYRSMDQLNAAVLGKSKMNIVGVWPGIQGAQNGKTHQTIGQPNAVMSIPNINYYEPADSVDMYNIFNKVLKNNDGINYIRLSKHGIKLERNPEDMKNTDSYFVHMEGKNPDALIISSGFPIENCVKAAKQLKVDCNLSVNVVNVVNLKDFYKIAPKIIESNCPILAVYNGSPNVFSNIIGKSIILNKDIPRPQKFESIGFSEGTTGKYNELIDYYGFDERSIKEHVLKLVR